MHEEFVRNFFNEEVFPFLAPVMIQAGDIRTFIRDRRLYLVIRMIKKSKKITKPDYVPEYQYALMKIPFSKVPRFIELPKHEDTDIKGVILSGSPYSVYDATAFKADLSEIRGKYPVLGICYGAQFMSALILWRRPVLPLASV